MICLNDKRKYKKIKSLSFHGWNIDPWERYKINFNKNKNSLITGHMKLKIWDINII